MTRERDPQFTYNLGMIKKAAIKELSSCGDATVGWYLIYFDFENYRIEGNHPPVHAQTDCFPILSVDVFDRVILGPKIDYEHMRHQIKLSDLTDDERKDLFDTIKTACDAVSL